MPASLVDVLDKSCQHETSRDEENGECIDDYEKLLKYLDDGDGDVDV